MCTQFSLYGEIVENIVCVRKRLLINHRQTSLVSSSYCKKTRNTNRLVVKVEDDTRELGCVARLDCHLVLCWSEVRCAPPALSHTHTCWGITESCTFDPTFFCYPHITHLYNYHHHTTFTHLSHTCNSNLVSPHKLRPSLSGLITFRRFFLVNECDSIEGKHWNRDTGRDPLPGDGIVCLSLAKSHKSASTPAHSSFSVLRQVAGFCVCSRLIPFTCCQYCDIMAQAELC